MLFQLLQLLPQLSAEVDARVVLILLALGTLVGLWAPQLEAGYIPTINKKARFELGYARSKERFQQNARQILGSGFSKTADAFWVFTDSHRRLLLSPKYANLIRNDERLSLGRFLSEEFHAHISGFEPFGQISAESGIVRDTVRMKVTQSLGRLIEPLSCEATQALQANWTDNPEWHSFSLKPTIMRTISQVSSRAFLGPEICRNPAWLDLTADYAEQAFLVARSLRLWPRVLRPLVAMFYPGVRRLRTQIQEARDILEPVLEKRRGAETELAREGKAPRPSTDTLDWLQECAKGRPFDPAVLQLTLSFVAIETTSEMLCNTIYDIVVERPDIIPALREEIITVIQTHGWQKSSMHRLQLLDSVLKESQRWKPTSLVSMHRVATSKLELPNGIVVPKNTSMMVSAHKQLDSSIYPDGENFDPYRFYNMRQTPGQEPGVQFVSTSPEHLGFGHGQHSCPGRFFAASELKVLLCHIILKYDMDMVQGRSPQTIMRGYNIVPNPEATLAVRRRQAEILC